MTRLPFTAVEPAAPKPDWMPLRELTSDCSAGEWGYGLDGLVQAVRASGLALYQWEHADLTRLWVHLRRDPATLADIPTIANGESPWGLHRTDVESTAHLKAYGARRDGPSAAVPARHPET